MIWGLGQDLGSQQDPSALAVVSQEVRLHPLRPNETETFYQVWATKLWQLNTSYLTIGEDMCRIVRKPPLAQPFLAFDVTGNIAYWNILQSLDPACDVHPIWITGGTTATVVENQRANVGKVELLSAMIAIFASGRLLIRDQPLGEVLKRQIQSLTVRITKALNQTVDIPRDATGHGDLAMAVALALWVAERTPVGWDGKLGDPSRPDRSILAKAPNGVFQSDPGLSAWKDPSFHQQRVYFDQDGHERAPDRDGPGARDGLPNGYIPPWGPDW